MSKIESLQQKGVIIPDPARVTIGKEVLVENIEAGVVLHPGVSVYGEKTLLGKGTELGKEAGGYFENVSCGRGVVLATGFYQDCVFLDHSKVRFGGEMRKGTLFMEKANAAHTVGCKMTVAGIAVTFGSLINFCDIFVSGGTAEPFGFTEIGSGAIHYNFTQNSLKFASLIGPGAAGEMFGLFPRTFIGGQTQIIGPTSVGSGCLIPAGTAVRDRVKDGMISVKAALPEKELPYDPEFISQAKNKFGITVEILGHYKVLISYFEAVRQAFARKSNDDFLARLYQRAITMLEQNVEERMGWLFSKQEDGQRVDLFSKLPRSLEIHQQLLRDSQGKKVRFHLENIYGHELLLEKHQLLLQELKKPLGLLFTELEKQVADFSGESYLEFLASLSEETKRVYAKGMQQAIVDFTASVMGHLQGASQTVKRVESNVKTLLPYLHQLTELYKHNKILISEKFSPKDLGVLNRNIDWYSDVVLLAEELFDHGTINISGEQLEVLFAALKSEFYPSLISWRVLMAGIPQVYQEPEKVAQLLQRASFRFHGTDGLRGTVVCLEKRPTLTEAIACYMEQSKLTPEMFEGLARNSIYAFEVIYNCKVSSVGIARDPRDIYQDDPQLMGAFYYAIKAGALATGRRVYDLGVCPIPNVPHTLAYFDSPSETESIDLILYKSASHNPASQDGLKIFLKKTDLNGQTIYSKAMADMEGVISALLVREALSGLQKKDWGVYHDISKLACEIFRKALTHPANLPSTKIQKCSLLVCDLSHGAFGALAYQKVLQECLEKIGIGNTIWVGNDPDGKNINSNEGKDRVGAAHFENVIEVRRAQTEKGQPYYGFPVLDKLFASREKNNGMAFALLTDGDGDRGLTMLYEPKEDMVHVFDGDKSIFLQLYQQVQEEKLTLGQTIAFTVESSVTFINAILKLIKSKYPVQLILDEETLLAEDKINLKLTPVGDKYILEQQAFGGETSGHVIRQYHNECIDKNTEKKLFCGNGFLANLHTIDAIITCLEQPASEEQQEGERLHFVTHPYQTPVNEIVYVYFVRKELWYSNSPLWNEVEQTIHSICQDYSLTRISFTAESDTMYYCSLDEEDNLEFAILARPSGTENKMGVKLYGTAQTTAIFQELSQKLFLAIARQMKNQQLRDFQDEKRVLQLLAKWDGQRSLAELQGEIMRDDTPYEKAHFMHIIEAVSQKCQKLAQYDGETLSLTQRGREYLAEASS